MEVQARTNVRRVIQVFEHQRLQVGARVGGALFMPSDFDAICRFAEKHGEKYFEVQHQSIRFKHYVGVIQVGALTIEILPKADRAQGGDQTKWQQALLGMLKVCRFLKPEKMAGATLGLQRHMLFDLYIELFIEEAEHLVREGLLRQYQRGTSAQNVLKGRWLFRDQLRGYPANQERFYCEHDKYTFDHPLNQVVGRALAVIKQFVLPARLQVRLYNVLSYFPTSVSSTIPTKREWDAVRYNRKTERYRMAVDYAYLILLNYSPDIRHGRHPLVALVFDMNLLFEEYVYRCLTRLQKEGLEVRRQMRVPFWHRSYLQPDIVLNYGQARIVLDTKWKALKSFQPSIEDLRQMYVYSQYFQAGKTVLLYPQIDESTQGFPATPFLLNKGEHKAVTCQLCMVPVLKNGRLNHLLGKELLERIGITAAGKNEQSPSA